jgi:hypothetical protein
LPLLPLTGRAEPVDWSCPALFAFAAAFRLLERLLNGAAAFRAGNSIGASLTW